MNQLPTTQKFKDFLSTLDITENEQIAVENVTRSQSESTAWFDYRRHRITASKFRDAVIKIDVDGNLKNPHRCKTLISKVCLLQTNVTSDALKWGRENEPVARDLYIKNQKSKHSKFEVKECGLFLDKEYPYLGASPDALVSCFCHGEGLLEIKCPWTYRNYTASKFAEQSDTFLLSAKNSKKLHLDKKHSYYYQIQLQMRCTGRKWCDFYVVFSGDTFLERIYYNEKFMTRCIMKASICYEKVIFAELTKNNKESENVEDCVKAVISQLLDKCEIADLDINDIDFDDAIDFEIV